MTLSLLEQQRRSVEGMLAISTAHLPEAEYREMSDHADLSRETGHTIYIGWKTPDGESYDTQDLRKIHPNMPKLIGIARTLNCCWIMWDRDRDVLKDVPAYDWSSGKELTDAECYHCA